MAGPTGDRRTNSGLTVLSSRLGYFYQVVVETPVLSLWTWHSPAAVDPGQGIS